MEIVPSIAALAALCALAGTAVANPVVNIYPAFISSEHLTAVIGDTSARFSGRFHFAAPPNISEANRSADVYLDIPIWLPAKPAEGDKTVKDFYATFKTANTKLTVTTRPVFDRAFGMEVKIGGRAHPINGFYLPDFSKLKNGGGAPKWLHDGFVYIVVFVTFRPNVVEKDAEVHISYRQPLRLGGKQAELFYVPNFDNLPKGRTTDDPKTYSFTVTNSGHKLVTGLGQSAAAQASMTLPLAHHSPILLTRDP